MSLMTLHGEPIAFAPPGLPPSAVDDVQDYLDGFLEEGAHPDEIRRHARGVYGIPGWLELWHESYRPGPFSEHAGETLVAIHARVLEILLARVTRERWEGER